jgi:hypothetical protein
MHFDDFADLDEVVHVDLKEGEQSETKIFVLLMFDHVNQVVFSFDWKFVHHQTKYGMINRNRLICVGILNFRIKINCF